jgi:hypothetical protein
VKKEHDSSCYCGTKTKKDIGMLESKGSKAVAVVVVRMHMIDMKEELCF